MSVYSGNFRNGRLPEKHMISESEKSLPFKIDHDTLLIAALLFLLIKDGGDMKLILALGYILL